MFSLDIGLWSIIAPILLAPAGYIIGKAAAVSVFNKKPLRAYLILTICFTACLSLFMSGALSAFSLLITAIFFLTGFVVVIMFDKS
ncbi:hypothetical protein CVU83_02480 [Candidatus Falkowbacteria bacterium HGW-Falkowbacteria-2]|uniref:Uncharacterized protein n=1 Tax=Candidatus Falkowbacteria bacterium HGW-Falkowbacteria-2 TaxID=2013769 RepID=A0A2N2DZG3_9BACT|nr:MAG: hypothetical protein CVU83_02480 [Candidatus Falkowbacteria bacterium HGW-Falkowbacteria-2]